MKHCLDYLMYYIQNPLRNPKRQFTLVFSIVRFSNVVKWYKSLPSQFFVENLYRHDLAENSHPFFHANGECSWFASRKYPLDDLPITGVI